MLPLIFQGLLLGWSVAWPPGPINAEMIRRGLTRGFFPAWGVGLGACSGDFLWALAVSLGAGALVQIPGVRTGLGILSVALLLFLAWTFGRGAATAWRERAAPTPPPGRFDSGAGGWLLGLTMALTSPWNIAFWLAVIGSQASGQRLAAGESLVLAGAVVTGAALWGLVLCTALRLGARFATSAWPAVTQGATAALMLAFAGRTAAQLLAR